MFIKTSTTNETTWAALKAAVDNGAIAQGDLVIFNLKNGEEVAVRATQDKKGKWFFVLEDCLADEHCMNKRPTNKGAWAACDTLDARKDRLDCWNWVWAYEVLSALPQSITLRNLERAHIEDGLHPTAICDYAGPFIRLTTEE